MAYQNITFPNPKLVHGLHKEVVKLTKIVTNSNTEFRISKQSNFRNRWTWPARAMSQTDIEAIIAFAESVDMALDSFNFYCPIKKQTYKVRFEDAGLSMQVEAMNTSGTVTYSTIGDIKLIEVFE